MAAPSTRFSHKKNTLIQSLAIAAALLVGCGGGEPEPAAPIVPETPDIDLITASAENKIDVVKQHIAAGTDLDQKDPNPNGVQTTSLGIAAAFGYTEVAKALIDGGADVNVPDKNGSTPLHTAAFMCHAEIVQALVAKGADKSARNNSGGTALESVEMPWEAAKGIYDFLNGILYKPVGKPLDYARLKADRPKIAELLR